MKVRPVHIGIVVYLILATYAVWQRLSGKRGRVYRKFHKHALAPNNQSGLRGQSSAASTALKIFGAPAPKGGPQCFDSKDCSIAHGWDEVDERYTQEF
ncbi:unnamed protein product [Vitrella brassicaformis CCMP3155]|uniref:Uncharacterized protein n=1 Tax=Vitrella brassicaformis (strain CCMP3155) TaxID=1169540 RepID=A0A0G4G0S7_VITBC|nr:unnamed protein product [Vitrella brassicaformis CCMP3155]|mmetsp:Transcript_20515/g.49967  ORF Transcript_20515/g.49967 Transcript_20515/m.49967 type:complete len:98 (-) Transcript_20515:254-547(-)|eukprot:CEM21232.1 unnamed protein product [Vitrella brassicaformis CCMP3155]